MGWTEWRWQGAAEERGGGDTHEGDGGVFNRDGGESMVALL